MELTRILSYQLPLIRGEDVRAVQKALMSLNVTPPCGSADGVYGQGTQKSVAGFQASQNAQGAVGAPLSTDGKVGPATWRALFGSAVAAGSTSKPVVAANDAVNETLLPVSRKNIARVKAWMQKNFGDIIAAAVAANPLGTTPEFDADTVYAVACQETAQKWVGWIDKHPAADIIAACVFDASGDWPNTSRKAFPQNTAAFRKRFPELTDVLIEEANRARRMQGWKDLQIVYKGYGIFQYDLQHIDVDLDYFAQRRWHSFEACMAKLISELKAKRAASTTSELREVLRRYNGSGARAEAYAKNVMAMRRICQES